MYIDNIVIKNIGPIDKFSIKPKFDNDNNPMPLVIIGDNGKGKTALSSYIADSLIELAKSHDTYRNIVDNEGSFYKIVSSGNIKQGKEYSSAIISYKYEKDLTYVEKNGVVNIEELKTDIEKESDYINIENKLKSEEFVKEIVGDLNRKDIEKIFDTNVLCFFPSYRSEKPSWMNEEAIKYNEIYEDSQRITGKLNKEIIVEHSEERNSQWIHSVIVDSLIDIEMNDENSYTIQGNVANQQLLKKAKKNLEIILKLILKTDNMKLSMNYRNQNNNFKITYNELKEQGNNIKMYAEKKINSLKDLSLGQAVLFNLFATIIRHADINNINNSIELNNIEGIVVIDEIDMHLDSEMQNEVLPKLLKQFPKIQFIITTHSPLFLLGMDKEFNDKYMLLEMPHGTEITTERFSEFEKSYKYLNDTKKHENELNEIISEKVKEITESIENRPLIITEGKTDWIHIKNALIKLKEKEQFKELEVDFHEFDFDMGEGELVKIKNSLQKIPLNRIVILIADRDTDNIDIKKFEENDTYKKWDKNLYTFRIPVPKKRENTPRICIEHYYTDNEIKTEFEIEGIKRRLFMANEFNPETGDFLYEAPYRTCKRKWNNSIEIFDSSDKCKVTKFKDDKNITYSLSKEEFANRIKEVTECNYEDFSLIFNIVKKIINDNGSQQ